MSKQKKAIWILGNILLGLLGFFAYLWGALQAWGNEGSFWLYPIGAVTIVLVVFAIFNFSITSKEKAKHWGISILILLGSSVVTILVHGLLQNTIFE